MSTPVLVTKLYVPQPGASTITRARLIERLDEGLDRTLTLVSAPAGFGKTTVVSRWVGGCGRAVAWLSLDEADSDPARFLTYLVAALQTVAPTVGSGLVTALQSTQPPPAESLLTVLLNEVAALPDGIALVLDDYHRIESAPVDDALAFLLDHLPSRLHLVITTREDPRLPLARLRARGQMSELRAADLRFRPDEATTFLNEAMGLGLSATDLATLETRTEGWIAGLQLAALSMRDHDDVSGFIRDFAGDDRYIVDYLADEVLRRQPEDVRDFLLRTSILDRMSGPLCDAVTGLGDSQRLLESLEQGNLFVVPLNARRRWYRYHHLFADVMRAWLLDEQPDRVLDLHRRASRWHERNGDLPAAIDHAFAAEDFPRAADLVEQAMPAMRRARREETLLAWLEALPDEVIQVRPVLSVDYAGTLLQARGDVERTEIWLGHAERWLDPASASRDEMIVWDAEEFRRLPGQIAIYRAGQALIRGDVAGTMRHAGRALDLLPEEDDFGRGAAAGLLGLALWTSGDLDAGHRMYTECMARLERAGFIADLFGCALVLADIRITQGRLRDSMQIYERALRTASAHSAVALRGTADMHVGMSELHLEWGDLDAAISHARASEDLGEHIGLRQNPYRWRVAMAGIRDAQGNLHEALALLLEAERLYEGDFSPDVRPIAAMVARLQVRQGHLAEAMAWARDRNLAVDDELSYLREFEHNTLARILIARTRRDRDDRVTDDAIRLLDRLLAAAETGGRTGRVIEILMLHALAREATGDIFGALGTLERAISLAEPEGYVRLFASEGEPMGRLLTEARDRGMMPDYTGRLLAALDIGAVEKEHSAAPAQALADPLSEREIEVLRLVAEGRSNREIADLLFLALDTVKGHNRRIFAKLDVQRRTEAIARARELGLL